MRICAHRHDRDYFGSVAYNLLHDIAKYVRCHHDVRQRSVSGRRVRFAGSVRRRVLNDPSLVGPAGRQSEAEHSGCCDR